MITIPMRNRDDLQETPALAMLSALSACLSAVATALDLAHPCLLMSCQPTSDRETAALQLHMHIDACHHLLRQYDYLTFELPHGCCPDPEDEEDLDGEDDLLF